MHHNPAMEGGCDLAGISLFSRKDAWPAVRAAAYLTFVYSTLAVPSAWSETRAGQPLTVSIVAPAYWCPYACEVTESGRGFSVEIAQAALESAGHNVEYRNMPLERALFEVRKGRFDAALPVYKDEAPGFTFPEHAVSLSEYCFYLPEETSWRYKGLESLNQIRFVATSGYSYGQSIDSYITANLEKSVALIQGENIPGRLRKMVSMDRYDALLDDQLLFESSQSSNGLVNAGCLNERHAGYLALSPENPDRSGEIAKAFDRGFERIRANGQVCKILEKYGLRPHFVPDLDSKDCPP